jgi:hypothetical protein
MSDDRVIWAAIAAVGVLGLMLSPAAPDPRYASLLHRISCSDHELHIDGVLFDHVQLTIACPKVLPERPITVDGDFRLQVISYNTFLYH